MSSISTNFVPIIQYTYSAFKVQNPVEQLYGWESFCSQEIFLVYAKNNFKVSPNSNPLSNTIVGHKLKNQLQNSFIINSISE